MEELHWATLLNAHLLKHRDPAWVFAFSDQLLEEHHFSETITLLQTVREQYPQPLESLHRLIQVVKHQGNPRLELELVEQLLAIEFSLDSAIHRGELLTALGHYEEAEAHFSKLLDKHPNNLDLKQKLAINTSQARDYSLALERWAILSKQHPNNAFIQRSYINSLLDCVEIEQAQAHFDQTSKTLQNPYFLSTQSIIYKAQSDWDKAIHSIEQLAHKYPQIQALQVQKAELKMQVFKIRDDVTLLDDALATLNTLANESPENNLGYRLAWINALVFSGNKVKALSEIKQLPNSKQRLAMRLRTWMFHQEGDIEAAKHEWQAMLRVHHVPQAEPLAIDLLQRKDSNPLDISVDEIMLFTAVRNEKWRLPWFLSYYRRLGVNRFFFIDNDSNDGTLAFLLKQPDVHVFWTAQSYAKSYSGLKWINRLVEEYGNETWCIYADVDEALVFPHVEQNNLKKLTQYMCDKGQEAFQAFMLDMFSDADVPLSADGSEQDFIAHYPLFNNHYHRRPVSVCPYVFISGGVRRVFGAQENLTKTPIIRGGKGIKFLASSHHITPAVLSDVTGAMLHFKLVGNYSQTFTNDSKANTRIAHCKRRHATYARYLKTQGGRVSLSDSSTMRYTSSQQLMELGLIHTSKAFEDWIKQPPFSNQGCKQNMMEQHYVK
jgi:tetratricopeptide (TPR) repeat protein